MDESSSKFVFEADTTRRIANGPVRHNENSPAEHTWKDNDFASDNRALPGNTPAAQWVAKAGIQEAYHRSWSSTTKPSR